MLHQYMQKNDGATGLMMRKAREWSEKSIAPFMRQTVIGRTGREIAVHKKADKLFQYHNGSTLYYGGMRDDDQRESVRSIGGDGGLDIALFEEANAFTEDDYNEIIGRVRGTAGDYRQIILITNPDAPTHWINRRLIIGQEAKVFYSSAKDNPHNAPEYLSNLEKMTGLLYERLVLGKWVQAEGVVFDNFDPRYNVTTDAEYNPDLRVIWGLDDGYVRGQGVAKVS
jgi:PBSX family phage terminase large subunit